MSVAYWSQWDHSEIMSMQGVEIDERYEIDVDFEPDHDEIDEDDESCKRCNDRGCNYCLCVSW